MTIEQRARELGLYVSTWAPGDGVRRYRFHTTPNDYNAGQELTTQLGRRDALIWLSGYASGRNACTR